MLPSEPLFKEIYFKSVIRKFLYVLIFNFIIALFLTGIKFGGGFWVNLVFSQCIGISIFLFIHIALYLFKTTNAIFQVTIIGVSIIIGAVSGTFFGSMANGINPALFFGENNELFIQTILFAILFGSIISYIFISRERVAVAKTLALEEMIKGIDRENRVIETNLKLLQSQIEPHFLFNTLSNILSLMDTDTRKAKSMMEDFIAFLRTSLSTNRDERTTIGHEIETIRKYLNIFKMRMGSRLSYRINMPAGLLDYPIPPLLIQPIVENAIRHGLEPKIDGGDVWIDGEIKGDIFRIIVADSGNGINGNISGNGIGLDNIRKRLQLLYNGKGGLILEENRPSGVRAIIEIPYETAK